MKDLAGSGDSLVAAVPFPLMSGFHGEEIGRSLVFHSLWEPQQDSVVQLPHARTIRRPGGRKRAQILPACEDVTGLFFPDKTSSLRSLGLHVRKETWKSFPGGNDRSTEERISGRCQICLHHVRLQLPGGTEASTHSGAGSRLQRVSPQVAHKSPDRKHTQADRSNHQKSLRKSHPDT